MNDKQAITVQFHHVAYSVKDIQRSEAFYKFFGFKCFKRWCADGGLLEIRHLANPDKFVIELFCFAKNVYTVSKPKLLEDDLSQLGIKHIAFKVDDIRHYRIILIQKGLINDNVTIKSGRTDILYFFIKDPDGNFIEIVQDDRSY